jgi:hypothetical protein
MRVQISKHPKARSQTVRAAVNAYNKAALDLKPPRQTVQYANVIDMAFLAQFDLLRHSRPGHDIRNEPWADPATRVLTDKYFELLRAKEEVIRLNVEWVRVRSWLTDEKQLYRAALAALQSTGQTYLRKMVQLRWEEVQKTHNVIWHWLQRTQQLPGFSGVVSYRRAINRERIHSDLRDAAYQRDVEEGDDFGDGGGGGGGEYQCDLDDGEEYGIGDAGDNGKLSGYVDDMEELSNMVDALGQILEH